MLLHEGKAGEAKVKTVGQEAGRKTTEIQAARG
jgi:hypothetical protein